jgi:hypothetical protein
LDYLLYIFAQIYEYLAFPLPPDHPKKQNVPYSNLNTSNQNHQKDLTVLQTLAERVDLRKNNYLGLKPLWSAVKTTVLREIPPILLSMD